MDRYNELSEIFRNVDEEEKTLVNNLISEVVYYEEQMRELRKLPFISIHPRYPEKQKMTAAAKLYKEYSTSYMNAIRILLNILRKVESQAQDDLLRRLEEFA